MKKFSVLLVAILALMMLFVSCENEPKERVATMKDGVIVSSLFEEASFFYEKVSVEGKKYLNVEYDSNTNIATFKGFEVYQPKDTLFVALNGTISMKPDNKAKTITYSLNLVDGTKYKDENHTLLANIVMNEEDDVVSYEIVLDGVILKDFVFGY